MLGEVNKEVMILRRKLLFASRVRMPDKNAGWSAWRVSKIKSSSGLGVEAIWILRSLRQSRMSGFLGSSPRNRVRVLFFIAVGTSGSLRRQRKT